MKQKRTFIILLLIVSILCLGIAYASITSVNLTISGTATASPDTNNFVVKFADNGATTKTGNAGIVATTTASDQAATLNISGLTAAGEKVVATWTIENSSADLSAEIEATTSEITGSTGYFQITTEIAGASEGKATIPAKDTESSIDGTTTVTVTVELLKTPIEDEVSGTINVELTATPVQP